MRLSIAFFMLWGSASKTSTMDQKFLSMNNYISIQVFLIKQGCFSAWWWRVRLTILTRNGDLNLKALRLKTDNWRLATWNYWRIWTTTDEYVLTTTDGFWYLLTATNNYWYLLTTTNDYWNCWQLMEKNWWPLMTPKDRIKTN